MTPELRRSLGVFDAVVIGLGSMVGAGIFVALAPAAAPPVRDCCWGWPSPPWSPIATPCRRPGLPRCYPASGGTYVYGRERLGEFWGYQAGWALSSGKTASCAAMALTVGYYVGRTMRTRWRLPRSSR